jgi:hypothetical protein
MQKKKDGRWLLERMGYDGNEFVSSVPLAQRIANEDKYAIRQNDLIKKYEESFYDFKWEHQVHDFIEGSCSAYLYGTIKVNSPFFDPRLVEFYERLRENDNYFFTNSAEMNENVSCALEQWGFKIETYIVVSRNSK